MRIAIEKEMRTRSGGKLTQSPMQVYLHQTIANEGWKGLQRLSREYGIPVALLAAAAGLAATEDGEEVAQ
jgi:hypothetical protein